MSLLYLVRHPRPSAATRMCYGRRDVSVDPAAIAAAAHAVRDVIPQDVLAHAPLYTSPSSRCLHLARELCGSRQPTVVDALREMSFGSWEGQAWDEIPRAEIDAWADDVWGYRAGGDESAAMVRERWRRFRAGLQAARDAVAVTHSGVIRVALVGAGVLREEGFTHAPIEFGSVHRLDLGGSAP
jgi:alpha-ribazole phosphatase